jgi:RNA polymerase sigma factor (TIGR02999 family)
MSEARGEITLLLDRLSEGDSSAEEALMGYIYAELHRVAAALMRWERPNHTLQPTALVHEVYQRLCRMENAAWRDRAHFFRTAARLMRRILVDHARRHRAQKRNNCEPAVPLDQIATFASGRIEEVLAVDEALEELAKINPRQAQIVEMRFFAGLSEEEIAEALGVSRRTVMRDWFVARAWLHKRLRPI